MADFSGKLGDYEVSAFDLISHNGHIEDLKDKLVSFQLYEDMYSPSLSAKISILDTQGLINYVPIIGQETVNISFITARGQTPINLNMTVTKVTGLESESATQTFNIETVTSDMVKNFETRISQSFSGSATEIAQQCFSKGGFSKLLEIEPSDDRYEQESALVIPNMTPFKAMTFLCDKAFSETYKSSSYVFFETTKGYNMKPMESFVETPHSNEFSIGSLKSSGEDTRLRDFNSENKKVQSYNFDSSFSVLDNITRGMYVGNATTVDLLTRNTSKLTHSFWDNYNDYRILNDGPFQDVSGTGRQYRPNTNYVVPERRLNDTSIYNQDKTFLQKMYHKQLMNNIKCTITVYGDSDLTAGQTVDLKVPLFSSVDSGELDKYYSGKYLIIAIRHRLEVGRYSMDIEMVKDSFNDSLPSPIPQLVGRAG